MRALPWAGISALIHRGSGADAPLVYIDLPLIDKYAVAGHIMDQMVALLEASRAG